jgi:lysophospholipase L1-like esterase
MKIKAVTILVSFILFFAHASAAQNLNLEEFHVHRGSLRSSMLKFENEKQGRIVFLGGSITFNGGWSDSVMSFIQKKYPDTAFDFINAGIPSMGSTSGAFRFQRDVLKNGSVDLLFVEAAINDNTNGRSADEIIRGMEGIVRHALLENEACDMVMMHFADPGKMKDYQNGKVPEVIQLHEKVAEHYGISSINLAKEVTKRIDAGEFDWENDFKDLHPSPPGQKIYFHSIKEFLNHAWKSASENQNVTQKSIPNPVDEYAYSRGVLIEPNPPKPIKGWEMIKNWEPIDGASTRQNYTSVPMLVGTWPGQVIKFPFEGNAVGIAVAAGPDAGIIEYSIDNSSWQKLDLFTKWSSGLHLPWFYTLGAGLKNRRHMLQIRLTDEKNPESNGNVCRLRYFYFNRPE